MKKSLVLMTLLIVSVFTVLAKADSASFRYGVNGYTGAHDTQITYVPAWGDDTYENYCEGKWTDAWLFYSVDSDLFRSVVLRFDDIFTATGEAGKIPLGSKIDSAILTLQIVRADNYEGAPWQIGQLVGHVQDFGDAPGDPYLCDRDGIVTWNERIRGTAAWSQPGLEEGTDFINAVIEEFGWENQLKVHNIDVTAMVQSWSDGSANEGFIIKQRDPYAWNNYIKIGTSENATEANRPMITVNFSAAKVSGDANGDKKVDVSDLGILAANYGMTSGATWEKGDFNGDGKVDVSDLGILAANYGTGTQTGADFNADYAKVFGTTAEEASDDATTENTLCSSLGLSLIAGLLAAGLMLIKLEE